MKRWIFGLWTASVAWVGVGGLAAARADEPAELARHARVVLKRYCAPCHHGTGSAGIVEFDVTRQPDLLSKELIDPPLVIPGQPDESYLFERVEKNQMPPKAIKERPISEEKDVIKRWIADGAKPFPDDGAKRPFITLVSILTATRNHLRNADPNDRPYLRFFTLHNLSNNPDVADDDLRLSRAALSKAVNSLSQKPHIVLPAAIDPGKTLFVVDIREIGWGRAGRWAAVERAYPYGLKFDSHPDEALRRADRDLADLSDCDIPLVRADWFVATATRPPLYHDLLGLPAELADLRREMGVDSAANFLRPQPERIVRGGFAKSGVSGQNREVERQEAKFGAYWESHDFKPTNGRANLSRFPLGPLNLFPAGRHPFREQAFVHDGGEVIFNLPNGLQAYLLVNGKGQRIDAGPIDVVSDSKKISGTPEIVTGLSCMSCHSSGMIRFSDTIRASSAVFGAAEEHVRQLYPPQDVMNSLLKRDEARFLDALELTIGPFVREGADKVKPIDRFDEPVAALAGSYRLNYLDLKDIARELEVQDPQVIVRQVGEEKIKQLGLDSLLRSGVVGRSEWEARLEGVAFRLNGLSLMQQLALEMRYTPVVPR